MQILSFAIFPENAAQLKRKGPVKNRMFSEHFKFYVTEFEMLYLCSIFAILIPEGRTMKIRRGGVRG